MKKVKNVDEYIALYPKDIQKQLKQMRATIQKAVPDAQEVLSYSMPAYKYHGMLAYFAVHTSHIGLYPMPSAVIKFQKEMVKYIPPKTKSTLQFPLGKSLPVSLITKIIRWRAKENLKKVAIKKNRS